MDLYPAILLSVNTASTITFFFWINKINERAKEERKKRDMLEGKINSLNKAVTKVESAFYHGLKNAINVIEKA